MEWNYLDSSITNINFVAVKPGLKMEKVINRSISIEALVELLPSSVSYLSRKGIKCIACGEPVWGTLEEAAVEKGFGPDEIDVFVKELNALKDNGS
jgi:hypothetical protein